MNLCTVHGRERMSTCDGCYYPRSIIAPQAEASIDAVADALRSYRTKGDRAEREAFTDACVADAMTIIAARRHAVYGSLVISDDQVRELANAVVNVISLNYQLRENT